MIRRCVSEDEQKWCELNLEFMAYEYEDANVWENLIKKRGSRRNFRRNYQR